MTAEQQARDLLDRMQVEGAQQMSAGELVELANMISEFNRMRAELADIAAIAHDGGLRGIDERGVAVFVRRVTLPHWDASGSESDRAAGVDAALAAATSAPPQLPEPRRRTP